VVAVFVLIPIIALAVISLMSQDSFGGTAVMRGILELTIFDTAYANEFSVPAFKEIGSGDTLASVKDLIGEPFAEDRDYANRWGYRGVETATISFTFDRYDNVLSYLIAPADDEMRKQIVDKVQSLSTSDEVERVYGKPSWKEAGSDSIYLHYSRSPSGSHYWHYFVVLDPYTNLVLDTTGEFYFD